MIRLISGCIVRCAVELVLPLTLITAATTSVHAQTQNVSIPVGSSGTLTYQYQVQTGSCGGPSQTSANMWQNFSYTPSGGAATSLGGSIDYVYPCSSGQINGGWDYESNSYSSDNWSNQLNLSYGYCTIVFDAYEDDADGQASISCPTPTTSTFDPLFKVVSILYSPPGNQSNQGYSTGTTHGTTTTIGSSFTFANELTFSSGIKDVLQGSASWGYSIGSGNSSAFTQTWTNATSYASDDNNNATYNPTASNALNDKLDTFQVWLNPQVTVTSMGSTPVSYNAASQPKTINGESVQLADVLPIPAIVMLAQPAGVTALSPSGIAGVSAVPVGDLMPVAVAQENGTNVYQPGLGAICKNNTLYQQQLAADLADPQSPQQICTQANQCGCTPADFAAIMTTDPLLNYNSTTYTANPGNGTTTPLAADALATTSGPGSGATICGENQPDGYIIPAGSNCRYVIVPASGSNIPQVELLNGAQTITYMQSDSTASSFATTASQSYNTGFSLQVGDLLSSLRTQNTWTWTDTEGLGTSTGGTNSMNVTLKTSTAACSENVNVYEDTIYHTYVYQIPTGSDCP